MSQVKSLQDAIDASDVVGKVAKLREVAEDATREGKKTAMIIRESKPNMKVVPLPRTPERSGVRSTGDTERLRALRTVKDPLRK